MVQKRYTIPALLLGLALLGTGSAAYAAFGGPGELPDAVLSGFTSDEQAAIQKAQSIRAAAEAEAQAVLDDAGVTESELRDAMDAFREAQRDKLDAALDADDYAAYESLVADTPMADTLTEDVFGKLVEIRKLEVAGDHDGAMELRKELGDAGFGHGERGHGGPMSQDE